jgi:hypothetical protein
MQLDWSSQVIFQFLPKNDRLLWKRNDMLSDAQQTEFVVEQCSTVECPPQLTLAAISSARAAAPTSSHPLQTMAPLSFQCFD